MQGIVDEKVEDALFLEEMSQQELLNKIMQLENEIQSKDKVSNQIYKFGLNIGE